MARNIISILQIKFIAVPNNEKFNSFSLLAIVFTSMNQLLCTLPQSNVKDARYYFVTDLFKTLYVKFYCCQPSF